MTQQEQQLLDGLIQRVNGTQLQSKDADAERFLLNALGPNPDALYILCQTVLVQQFAMENSQHELETLRDQLDELEQQAPAKSEEHTSFLGNLFGLKKNAPAVAPAGSGYQPVHDPGPGYVPQQGYPQQGYPPQQGYQQYGGQPGYPPPPPPPGYGYGQPMGGGGMFGGGGFLAGAAQTAAGVVAGEMAFRALEDVFSSGSHGIGGFDGGSREIVNNNYYDDSGSRDGSSFGDRLGAADGLNGNAVSPDIEDRRGESSGFFGGGDSNDTSNFADDNSGFDDNGGGFDDGGGGGGDDNGF